MTVDTTTRLSEIEARHDELERVVSAVEAVCNTAKTHMEMLKAFTDYCRKRNAELQEGRQRAFLVGVEW